MTRQSWMVVRKSRTIIGGYRVIAYGLTEDAAQRRASRYKTPHEAMDEPDLLRIRLAALRGKPDGWPDVCASCGAAWTQIGFDYADGFNCRACGRTDADE